MTFFSFDCIRNLAFKAFRGSPGIYEEISGKFHIPRVLVHLNFLIQLGPFYPRFSLHENEIDRVEMRRKGDEEGRKRCEREREREKERKREKEKERATASPLFPFSTSGQHRWNGAHIFKRVTMTAFHTLPMTHAISFFPFFLSLSTFFPSFFLSF